METRSLAMDIRTVDVSRREVTGVCVPYNVTTHAVDTPGGERIVPGAFAKSIRQTKRLLMWREHGHRRNEAPIGQSVEFLDGPTELVGRFVLRSTAEADQALADFSEGYLPGLSVGFLALDTRRAPDGVTEVVQARLIEVSGVALPAYEGAEVLAVRHIEPVNVETFLGPMPEVNLSPIAATWAYPRH